MTTKDLTPLFADSDDQMLLFALRHRIDKPRTEVQRTFCDALDAIELVHSDGFEMLFKQTTPLENYAEACGRLGLPQVQPIFSKVLALIPRDLRLPENEEGLFEHLRSHFEELKELSYEFYNACTEFEPIAARYVRQHRDEFGEYVEGHKPDTR
jgi:uncharacterized protein DUF4375